MRTHAHPLRTLRTPCAPCTLLTSAQPMAVRLLSHRAAARRAGRYSCFGYTVEGARFLSDLKEGDIIESAKVVEGLENLVQPK